MKIINKDLFRQLYTHSRAFSRLELRILHFFLWIHCKHDYTNFTSSQITISDYLHEDRSNVRKAIKSLKEKNILESVSEKEVKFSSPNTWNIHSE